VSNASVTDISRQLDQCWELGRIGQSTEGLVEAQRLLVLARRGGDRLAIAQAHTCNAWFCLQLGYADEGLDCAVEAISIYRDSDQLHGLALASSVYSWLLLELGLSDLSYEQASAAVLVAQKTNDTALQAFATSCRGMALMLCRQDQLAFPMLEQALETAEQAADACTIALNLINLAYSLVSQAELAEAEGNADAGRRLRERSQAFNDRAIVMARRYGDLWNLRIALCNGAEALAIDGQHDLAERYLAEWRSLPGRIGPREEIHYLYTSGEALLRRGELEQAHATCRQAVFLASNNSSVDHKANTMRRLSDVEAAMGDFPSALEHYRAYHEFFIQQMGEQTRRRAQVAEMQLQNQRLRARAERLEIEASQDALTGIGNRRAFEAHMASLDGAVCALLIVDLDHFKRVNDRHSHMTGDNVLRQTAGLISTLAGAGTYRLGGEEFAAVLPGLDVAAAMALAEDIRHAIAHFDWSSLAIGLEVTASIGVVGSDGRSAPEMFADADRRLYEAKAAGRNSVVGEPPGVGQIAIAPVTATG
jgi:diguanylate cyclase